jgi:hypothetical protein
LACSYFDTTDGYLRFISTVGQTAVIFFGGGCNFSGGLKNIASQTTVPFFPGVIFSGHNWCSYFDTSTNYGTYIRAEKITTRKKGTVIWPAMFFSGFKLQPKKITTQKKKVQSSGRRLKSMFFGGFK